MWNKIRQFNRWHDNLNEPWRFFFIFVPVSLLVMMVHAESHVVWNFIGIGGLVTMAFWAMTRISLWQDDIDKENNNDE